MNASADQAAIAEELFSYIDRSVADADRPAVTPEHDDSWPRSVRACKCNDPFSGAVAGWFHTDGTECDVLIAPDDGTRWWCTVHQQHVSRMATLTVSPRSRSRGTRRVTPERHEGAHMSRTPTPAPHIAEPAHDLVTDQPAEQSSPVMPGWSDLAAPITMPSKLTATNVSVNVLQTIPFTIRARAEYSLTANVKAVADAAGSNAKRPRVNYHWEVQPVPSENIGNDFIALITRYAKNRPDQDGIEYAHPDSPRGQVTARTGNPAFYVIGTDGILVAATKDTDGAFLGVRYSVRPFQRRADIARLPGTA